MPTNVINVYIFKKHKCSKDGIIYNKNTVRNYHKTYLHLVFVKVNIKIVNL